MIETGVVENPRLRTSGSSPPGHINLLRQVTGWLYAVYSTGSASATGGRGVFGGVSSPPNTTRTGAARRAARSGIRRDVGLEDDLVSGGGCGFNKRGGYRV